MKEAIIGLVCVLNLESDLGKVPIIMPGSLLQLVPHLEKKAEDEEVACGFVEPSHHAPVGYRELFPSQTGNSN